MKRLLFALLFLFPVLLQAANPSYSTSTRIINPSNLIYWADYVMATNTTNFGTSVVTNNLYASNVLDRANVRWWGAKGDSRKVTDGRIVSGNANVFSLTANFTSADVGKVIWAVQTATGLARLPIGLITNVVNSTNAIANTLATVTLSDVHMVWGTDDTTAIRAAVANASNNTARVYLPSGGYVFSRYLVDLNYSALVDSITFEGDGPNNTKLFPSPAFDFTDHGLNGSMLTFVANLLKLRLIGFSFDSSFYAFANTVPAISLSGRDSLARDVAVFNHQFGTGMNITGAGVAVEKCFFEFCYDGIVANGASVNIIDSHAGNCLNSALRCYGIQGTNNSGGAVRVVNCLFDENTSDTVSVENGSTDCVFVNCKMFSFTGSAKYAAVVQTNCQAQFIGCQITPYLFNVAGGGGLRVHPGGKATLVSCRLDGSGTNAISSYAITNGGTVYDGGNNIIGGAGLGVTNSGAGSILSDFTLGGQLWLKANQGRASITGSNLNAGWDFVNNFNIVGYVNGSAVFTFNDSGFVTSAGKVTLADTAILRQGSGLLEINNGTSNARRDLRMRGLTVSNLFLSVTTVALIADNQSVSVTNFSYIRLSSDDGVAANRTFVLSSGSADGQLLELEWTGTNAGELADDFSATGGGNGRLSATWTPTQYDRLALQWNGTDWVERNRAAN